jgi:hypothetical protein
MRNICITVTALALCTVLAAQQALNNDSVIKLVRAGLSDDLIISTINASPGIFDTSVDGIIALKAQGASDKVVSAVLLKGAPASSTASSSVSPVRQPAQDPNDPMSEHEPGIYMMTTNHDGSRTMVLLKQPNMQLRPSHTIGNAMSMGMSGNRMIADLPGTRAALRASGNRPEFYIYFPQSGTVGFAVGSENPREEFSLRKVEVKLDHREATVAEFHWVGTSNYEKPGPDKWAVSFTSEAIRAHAFRVTPSVQLSPGEYAFTEEESAAAIHYQFVSTQTRANVFDFGVD